MISKTWVDYTLLEPYLNKATTTGINLLSATYIVPVVVGDNFNNGGKGCFSFGGSPPKR
jgi:hypothetical protein